MKQMKVLLIAEKPSLMRDIQRVYQKMNLPYQIDFSSFVGHVVELKEPHEYDPSWAKWDKTVLPMIPQKFEFRVKKSTKDVHAGILKKINENNYISIINACDSGLEGENIFYSFYRQIGCKIPVKRFWTSQTTDGAIEKALRNLIDENDPSIINLRTAAMFRAVFDWLLGLNLTRAISANTTIPVGRVMTPTLAIIVNRENEILNFTSQTYYQIEGQFNGFNGIWFDEATGDNKIWDIEKAKLIGNDLDEDSTVKEIKSETESTSAPSLHSLLELQKEANQIYGYSSKETLELLQKLYEKKYVTYPRTESKHLPTEFAQSISKNLNAISSIEQYQKYVASITPETIQRVISSKKYVDNKKLTDHHAITVTTEKPQLSAMNEKEKNVYELIVKRLLSIFMKPLIIEKSQIIMDSNGHLFKSSGRMIIDKGFTILYEGLKNHRQDVILPVLNEGQIVSLNGAKLLKKETEPPSRYNDSSLLDAMFHAGRFIQDKALQEILKDSEGIGTSATRAEIIDKLIRLKMIERKGKVIHPTMFGIEIINSLHGHDLISPELTAVWSKKLKDLEEGKMPFKQFHMEMVDYTKLQVASLLSTTVKIKQNIVGTCPLCKQDVVERGKIYKCSDSACNFTIAKVIMGATITAADVSKILEGKETKVLSFTWKSGKKGKARLIFKQNKLEFVFDNKAKK